MSTKAFGVHYYVTKSKTSILFFALGIAGITLTAIELSSDQFTGRGFDPSVIYHIRYGLDGAGFKESIGVH
ncbi:MAG: hypothetical protein EOP48_35020 [Sphingobacteriales bacterium]|nr:MAG: hypothetical protein EOP48_35020 [Sphingobacteriales bacterium]